MVAKFTTDESVDKTRPPGCIYNGVRGEVGEAESGDTGNFPNSENLITNHIYIDTW